MMKGTMLNGNQWHLCFISLTNVNEFNHRSVIINNIRYSTAICKCLGKSVSEYVPTPRQIRFLSIFCYQFIFWCLILSRRKVSFVLNHLWREDTEGKLLFLSPAWDLSPVIILNQ